MLQTHHHNLKPVKLKWAHFYCFFISFHHYIQPYPVPNLSLNLHFCKYWAPVKIGSPSPWPVPAPAYRCAKSKPPSIQRTGVNDGAGRLAGDPWRDCLIQISPAASAPQPCEVRLGWVVRHVRQACCVWWLAGMRRDPPPSSDCQCLLNVPAYLLLLTLMVIMLNLLFLDFGFAWYFWK